MKIVITGGIGSGKSTVAELLADKLGFEFISFDKLVDSVYPELTEELEAMFGTSDRKMISDAAFKNADVRIALEKIFATRLSDLTNRLFTQWAPANFVLEFPLLFEKGQEWIQKFDQVITVTCSKSLSRTIARDGISAEKFQQITAAQTTNEVRVLGSDLIIDNSGSIEELKFSVSSVADEIKKTIMKGSKVGIVSGSFDPITLGHTWIIQRALDVVDYVVIAVAYNPTKKHLFEIVERINLIHQTMDEVLTKEQRKRVIIDEVPPEEMIVGYAANLGAKFIFRGLRGVTDLEYENQLNLLQKKIAPEIETIFLLTPRELIEISSSLIKGVLHLKDWEKIAKPYVPNCVLSALAKKWKK